MDDVKAGLQYAFQTENSLTFAVSGTGHAGMECAILNLLEPGETILVVQNGVWGQRAADLANRLNLNVTMLSVPEGEVVDIKEFEKVLHTFSIAFMYWIIGRTKSQAGGGIYLPWRELDRHTPSIGGIFNAFLFI